MIPAGAIDCDIHPAVPNTRALLPHLEPYWREHILRRGMERDNLEASAFPAAAPINARPDWQPDGRPARLQPARRCRRICSTRCSRARRSATSSTARR